MTVSKMIKTCGNCLHSRIVKDDRINCEFDLPNSIIRRITDVSDSCKCFTPKYQDLKLTMIELLAEYYQGENVTPIAVVVKCSDGRRFLDQASRIYQVRCAGWVKADAFYSENGNRYRREIWRPAGESAERGVGLPVVVSTKNEIGPRHE